MKFLKRLFLIITGTSALTAVASIVNPIYGTGGCVKTGCPHGFTHQCVHLVGGDECDSHTFAIDCCGNYN